MKGNEGTGGELPPQARRALLRYHQDPDFDAGFALGVVDGAGFSDAYLLEPLTREPAWRRDDPLLADAVCRNIARTDVDTKRSRAHRLRRWDTPARPSPLARVVATVVLVALVLLVPAVLWRWALQR